MPNYSPILEKLRVASEEEKNLHCFKVLDQLISLFETMELKHIPKAKFSEALKRLDIILSTDLIYVRQLTALKTDVSDVLRKEFGLTTRLYYRTKWLFNGTMFIGIPLGFIAGTLYGFESLFNLISPIGIVLGLILGIAIGTAKDKKAAKQGTQLSII
uniref:hypothetical protein n=1 Tax=Roseivirga sp. TaxID=1964215 RepID=UPI0040479E8F